MKAFFKILIFIILSLNGKIVDFMQIAKKKPYFKGLKMKKILKYVNMLDQKTVRKLFRVGIRASTFKKFGISQKSRRLFLNLDPIKAVIGGLMGVGGYALYTRYSENKNLEHSDREMDFKEKILQNLKFTQTRTMDELKQKLAQLATDVEGFSTVNELSLNSLKENTDLRIKKSD